MTSKSSRFSDLESSLRDFEPVFWVGPKAERLDRIFEPDGTLYAICLDGPTILSTDRRNVTVNFGDLVIVPPAVALEMSPDSRWFGLVYTGPYPYHFRERFIQVWGFEHHAFEQAGTEPLLNDPRHRLRMWRGHSAQDVTPGSFTIQIELPVESDAEKIELPVNSDADSSLNLCWVTAGQSISGLNSSPNSIFIEIPNEAVYLMNREAKPRSNPAETMSPEYKITEP